MRTKAALFCFLFFVSASLACGQELSKPLTDAMTMASPNGPGKAPNSDSTYQALRNVQLSNETSAVNNLLLKRDAGEFNLKSGTFQFAARVNGKVTGAVFIGEGSFSMTPPLAQEMRSLSLLTKEPAIHEDFNVAVFRFTDGTYEEIKKAGGTGAGGGGAGEFDSLKKSLRTRLHYNLDARILQDVLSEQPGGLFVAFIKGRKYNSKEIYTVDPHGVDPWAPEEVSFETWDESKLGSWSVFHLTNEYATGQAIGTQRNGVMEIDRQKLDTRLEKNGKMDGDAKTRVIALQDGLRVIPFDLFPTLRVSSVSNANGEQLDFIQEGKDDDPQFSVILPKPLQKGESYLIRTVYAGKEAVRDEGGGNYFPVARTDWFPNTNEGNYATYEMTFYIPKNLTMVATGHQTKNVTEGNQNVTEWKSEVPQAVAGFNFGQFKRMESKEKDITVEAYANENPPDWVRSLSNGNTLPLDGREAFNSGGMAATLGTMDTTGMMKKPFAEAQLAMKLYTDYFGASAYKRVAMTQQTACTFGQSWPTLVYMPICSFFDGTVRHQLGLDDTRGYWQVVGPHEVAHQWWGHTVGWSSYRDQWMSEGFAEMSASLFIQAVYSNQKFLDFWKEEHELLTEKNKEGFRAIDVGPLTLGYRLNNTKAGFSISRRLIYPKGGYVLHMLRMMMWDRQKKDEAFRDMMRDYVITYMNKPASTEDFKAMVEKHMTPQMDLDHNRKMDWFFNEYVYGTQLPNYSFDQSVDEKMNLHFKLTQASVTPEFKMLVPVYLELANGNVVKLGAMPITGNSSSEQVVPLGNALKEKPRRALINYYYDVLATQ